MKLIDHDLNYCLRLLPWQLSYLLGEFPGSIVAGGFIRSVVSSEPISDIDVWTPNAEMAKAMAEKLSHQAFSQTDTKLISTANAITVVGLEWPVQFVHKWTFDSAEAVLDHFDFTIARACLWHDKVKAWCGECDDRFYPDLAAKRLVYCDSTPIDGCGGSMLRLLKFYRKGYRAPLETIATLIERVAKYSSERSMDIVSILAEIDPVANPRETAYFESRKRHHKTVGRNGNGGR